MEIAEICSESNKKRGEKSLIKSDINGRLIQRGNLQGTGDPGVSSSGRHRAQDAVALDLEDLHHAVERRGALEAEASGTHDQSLQSIMTFDGALYKTRWENSGSDGVKATEAIGLQGIPALYGEYNALVWCGFFQQR